VLSSPRGRSFVKLKRCLIGTRFGIDSHFPTKETDLVGWTVKVLKISNDRHTLHAMEKTEK